MCHCIAVLCARLSYHLYLYMPTLAAFRCYCVSAQGSPTYSDPQSLICLSHCKT